MDEPYSLVLESKRFALCYTSKNSSNPMLYFDSTSYLMFGKWTLDVLTFNSQPKTEDAFAHVISLHILRQRGLRCVGRRSHFSLEILVMNASCQGVVGFGLYEDSQCVACPSPNGLMGWSESCAPPKLKSCKPNDTKFYKLEGVDHYIVKYSRGSGPMKKADCSRKCTSDCKCLSFFFNWAESWCWVVNDLEPWPKLKIPHIWAILSPHSLIIE
ncbi:UNVERIFIED_CONTAM: EP1-like glycoprotein 2 [Sesamum indicum]